MRDNRQFSNERLMECAHKVLRESLEEMAAAKDVSGMAPWRRLKDLVDQVNAAVAQFKELSGDPDTTSCCMTRDAEIFGLTGPVTLSPTGIINIPRTDEPIKTKVIRSMGGGKYGPVRNSNEFYTYNDCMASLKGILKGIERSTHHFHNYDPNWEDQYGDPFADRKAALQNFNKQGGFNTNAGLDYISKD